jgi:DNA repair exonuclease SbcCD ATPase subunit
VLLFCLALVAGCGQDKKLAETALQAAEQAVNSARADAEKYAPDQLKGVVDAFAAAQASFDKGDYQAAQSAFQDLVGKAKAVLEAASAKKTELTASWQEMSAGVPQMVETAKSRIEALLKSKKLPAGVKPGALDEARAALDTLIKDWTEASDASKAGNLSDAVTKATAIKNKLSEILEALGAKTASAEPPQKVAQASTAASTRQAGAAGDTQTGLAAYYAKRFHGRRTASGERFNNAALTTAHQSLPFGTKVRITNLKNNRSVVVRVNDRGPT